MSVLAECPVCHKKQAGKNRLCSCGEDLVKAKKSQRVRYWIAFRVEGKQRREAVGFSIDEARDADGKRKVQKRENRIFEMLPEAKMTFKELADWYVELPAVKRLRAYERVRRALVNFNDVFGAKVVNTIRPEHLEAYQAKREEEGRAPATIDLEITEAKAVINKAFENDLVDGRVLKTFKRIKARLKAGANARERTLTIAEYLGLIENAPAHQKALLAVAFHTGMRRGELLALRWVWIDRTKGFIRLPAEVTKEGKTKAIPIKYHVRAALESLPRALHHDFVFTYRGEPRERDIRGGLKKACKGAGIVYGQKEEGGFRFHDLRATFDTNMDRAGVSESVRKTIVGHTLKGMDRHYIRPTEEDLTGAIEKYTAWFDAQSANVDQNVDQAGNGES